MRGDVFTDRRQLVVEECCSCGIVFAMPDAFKDECLERKGPNGKAFYCPNGHRQWYAGKTKDEELAELRGRIETERKSTQFWRDQTSKTERQLSAQRGVTTRIKRRVAAGVCPCCKRSFANLREHMKGEHPTYVEEE